MKRADLISSFTPSNMPAETLEAIFVQREPLAQKIVGSVEAAASTGNIEHHLAVGPRGIGKTHLLSLIAFRLLAKPDLAERIAVAWLREEEWGVSSVGELYERMLVQLATGPDVPGTVRTRSAGAVEQLRSVGVDHLADLAESLLPMVLEEHLLVVVVENLDQLFHDIGTDDQHRLRAFLQNQRNAVLLASTPSLSQSIALRSGMFFGFFAIHHLDELTLDEARQLLTAIAELRDDDEGRRLVEYLATDKARQRLAVVEHLAGGHPRLWVLMAECITTERLEEVVGLLLAVLDDLTPYYQSQMKALPAQQRKIVMYLSRVEGARSVSDIAAGVRVQERAAAAQLGKLTGLGYVRKAALPSGIEFRDRRTSAYELREPLLRHVLEVKESRGQPLRLIVELLRAWFDPERLTLWSKGSAPLAATYAAAALDRGEQVTSEERRLLTEALRLIEEGSPELALRLVSEDITFTRNNAVAHQIRGIAFGMTDRLSDAIDEFDKSIRLDATDANAHANCAIALYNLGDMDRAAERFATAVSLDPALVEAQHGLASSLGEAGQNAASLEAFDVTLNLAPDDASVHDGRGVVLWRLGRAVEAGESFDEAIALDPNAPNPRFNRMLLDLEMNGRAPSSSELETALALTADVPTAANLLTHLLSAASELSGPSRSAAITSIMTSCRRVRRVDAFLLAVVRSIQIEPNSTRQTWWEDLASALHSGPISGPIVDLLDALLGFERSSDGSFLVDLPIELRTIAYELLGLHVDG